MRNKTLNIGTSLPQSEAPGLEFFGDPNTWELLCKANCDQEGWMKSTKAMEIPGFGCLVQVTTHQIGRDGVHAVAEAIVAVPGVVIDVDSNIVKNGEVVARRLVDTSYLGMAREEQPCLGDLVKHEEAAETVVLLTRKGLEGARNTFGPIKFGIPQKPTPPNKVVKTKPKAVKKTTAKKTTKAKARPSKS
jgi:hypothetical protein